MHHTPRTGLCVPTLLLVLSLLPGLVVAGGAQESATGLPSPEDVLGYSLGERFTDVAAVNRYMEELARSSPLVSVEPYGTTVEGRPLIQVIVASAAHRARLDEILSRNRELVDPSTAPERADRIGEDNPAVVYFSYGVHGNESSSSEAALWTAWDLARGADDVAGVLDSLVVVLDPVVNPDGRDRYVGWYRGARGAEPDPDPRTREHREPWPGGRYNHYLFDLNRDWSWMTQPETRARLATWDRWTPQVHVDFHEMSYRSTYFFFPATPPINPIYPDLLLDWARRFGEGNARAFDREGWLYYTAEGFDLFYPGYGDTWPSLTGAVGMTYEQAGGGAGGLVVKRPDGTLLSLRDRALHHRTSGNATLRTAAEGRSRLLSDFARFHREVDRGLPDILLVPDGGGRARALVELLRDQGVRVERAGASFRADAMPHGGYPARDRFPAGSYLVRARQPRGKLAVTLLRPEVRLEAEFSYDITGWSLPYAFGVEAHAVGEAPDGEWVLLESVPEPDQGPSPQEQSAYGYVLPPTLDAAPGLVDFLEAGGRAFVVQDTFSMAGRSFPRGTVFLPTGRNPDLAERIRDAGLGSRVVPVATGLTEGGPDLGSDEAGVLELPSVALLGGPGTTPTSYGAHWFFLEQWLGIPFDALNVADVAVTELDDYDVVVAPAGRLGNELGEGGLETLEAWIRAGGVLVAVDAGARDLASLTGVEERGPPEDEDELDRDTRLARALRSRRDREEERWRERVPGTILRVHLDPRHPLAFGAAVGDEQGMFVLTRGNAFEPDESFESVAYFPAGVEKVSGVISPESLRRLDRSTWLLEKELGKGKIILFADDPLFRMFWRSTFQPYVNALLLGPAL